MVDPTIVSHFRNQHRFYDLLFAFLINAVYSVMAAKTSRSLTGNPQGEIFVVGPGTFIVLDGRAEVSNTDVLFKVTPEIHARVLAGEIPPSFQVAKMEHHDPGEPRIIEADLLAHGILAGAVFVNYYESVVDQIEAKYGPRSRYQSWPSVSRFGRLLRNAFAHGGVVNIDNPRAPGESWRGVTYRPADNGRRILFNDLGVADVIVLIEEMDQEIFGY